MAKKYSKQKTIAIILLFMLTVSGLAGCSNTEKASRVSPEKASTTITITDMSGRQVTVPKEIKKVYSAVPIGTVLVYTIDPSKLAAKNFKLSELEKKYTTESYHALPVLGNFIVTNTANEEAIMKLAPDLILYTGIINDIWRTKVEEAQKKMGIPIVIVDGNLKNVPAAYEFLGKLLNEEKRAKKLSNYCRNTLEDAERIAGEMPEGEKTKVYYACGKDGLMTYAVGNIHSEIIDLAGGKNVVETEIGGDYSFSNISLEQLIKWNPQVIVTNKVEARGGQESNAGLRSRLLENASLSNLEAVKKNQVYEIPCAPFSWFGQPPSAARILGIKWLGNLLYPEKFDFDIKNEVKDFYKLFYNRDLSDEDIQELMSHALAIKE
ncbi:MAG: ABC transporter substrate-binding protein [Syntrophomonadaceae bacterium]|nr:ABC transporter substrate-binding protein [Syntrophomonadaceae bacterium]MDD3023223.1 ABC transporter substrate-binding protein [Syntrophomonadaceae bacterium]